MVMPNVVSYYTVQQELNVNARRDSVCETVVLGQGIWYDLRLGKPLPTSGLKSEWFDWFLRDIDEYAVKAGSIALWRIGGAGVILKTTRTTIYVDPYCGGSLKSEDGTILRMLPLAFNSSDVKNIDATVITHEHPDHLSEDFVFPVSKNTKCVFVGPSSVADLLESWGIRRDRIVLLREGEELRINDLKIIGFQSNDNVPKTALSYVFESGGIRIFHGGDSLLFKEMTDIGRRSNPDIALISLGKNPPGVKYYNTPAEVVEIAKELRVRVVIPIHWDLFDFLLEDPYLVEREAKLRKMDVQVAALRIGERFDYPQ